MAVNHGLRFSGLYAAVLQEIQSEAFGELASVTDIAGNMGFSMRGTYYFDLFRYATGEPIDQVSAWLMDTKVPNPRGPQFEDRGGEIRLQSRSGKRFFLQIGCDQGHGLIFVFAGSTGYLIVNKSERNDFLSVREREYRDYPLRRIVVPSEKRESPEQRHDPVDMARAMLSEMLNGGSPTTGEDGRTAVAALVAAHMSNERGHVAVQISETTEWYDRVFP